jgi:chemotaxis protein methyltransferase CheR
MVLVDAAQRGTAPGNFALIGSDISRRILNTAQRATYSEAEIAGVSEERRTRYLMKSKRIFGAGRQHFYRIIPQLRERAMFEPANLTQLQSARSFTVDFAFLRNLLIYFEEDMQEQVVSGVISRIRPGGLLLTGHSEALPPRPDLRALAPSIYQKV